MSEKTNEQIATEGLEKILGGKQFRVRILVDVSPGRKENHSYEFTLVGNKEDEKLLASAMREFANMLEAPIEEDPDLF